MTNQSLSEGITPVRWGILSTSNIACAKLIPAMQASPYCEVRAIGSRNLGKAGDCAERLGIEVAYGSYEEVLDDPLVEAVYIPLPNHMHVDYTLAAVAKGKHVLCEKPIAMTAAEAERLADLPKGIVVAEGFMVRHHPQWLALRDALRRGDLGAPRSVQVTLSQKLGNRDDIRFKPEIGGGAIYDFGCYATAAARYVFESEPQRVVSLVERNSASGIDELTTAILDFGNGRHATFTVGMSMAASQRVQILCDNALIELPLAFVPADDAPAEMLVNTSGDLGRRDMATTTLDPVDQYECEVTNFAKIVRGAAAPFVGVEDAIRQMRVIDALFASEQSGAWKTVAR